MSERESYDYTMHNRAAKIGSSYSRVPSKAWIEEQEELANGNATLSVKRDAKIPETHFPPTKHMSKQEYRDMMNKRASKMGGVYLLRPSKAWIEEQEELARNVAPLINKDAQDLIEGENEDVKKLVPIPVEDSFPIIPLNVTKPLKSALKNTSPDKQQASGSLYNRRINESEGPAKRPPKEEDNKDVKGLVPIPVVDSFQTTVKAPSTKPLKSALKKTSSFKQQTLEPLYKSHEYHSSYEPVKCCGSLFGRGSEHCYSEIEKGQYKPYSKNGNEPTSWYSSRSTGLLKNGKKEEVESVGGSRLRWCCF